MTTTDEPTNPVELQAMLLDRQTERDTASVAGEAQRRIDEPRVHSAGGALPTMPTPADLEATHRVDVERRQFDATLNTMILVADADIAAKLKG